MFLSPSESGLQLLGFAKCLNKLSVAKQGSTVIVENRNDILTKCKIDKPIKNVKNKTLLITSTALAFFGIVYLIGPLTPSSWITTDGKFSVYIMNIVQIFVGVSVLLAGIYGISKFSNYKLKRRFAYQITLIIFLHLLYV